MAYTPPTITSAGLNIPTYQEILDDLIEKTKSIYGQDIYIGPDSQDYQFLSIFALKTYDIMQLLQLVYNNRSPSTAIGTALASIVKLNGISKKTETYSTCPVVLTGTAFTQIKNGVIEDITGYKWSLPAVITLGNDSTATVTATCQVPGPIVANPGDINVIVTPTYGWTSVTNTTSATPGSYAETDSELRSRQAMSVSLSSITVLDSLRSAISAVATVSRSEVYQNDTNDTDANGLSPHSIAIVVDGGDDIDIANAIFLKKSPGVYTQGTTSVEIVDSYGQANIIRFYRLTPVGIEVVINVKKLTGYTDQTTTEIKSKIASFLNTLKIGVDVSISSLWGAALSAMPSLTNPSFSITGLTAAAHGSPLGSNDISIAFNEAAMGDINLVTVNVL